MLGIYRNTGSKWRRWIQAWFDILDNLFSILTFDTYYMDLSGWWFFEEEIIFGKSAPTSIKRRLAWCVVSSVEIIEELIVILTLGYLEPDWVYSLYFYEEK